MVRLGYRRTAIFQSVALHDLAVRVLPVALILLSIPSIGCGHTLEERLQEEAENTEFIPHGKALGIVHHVYVVIQDNVKGQCWTNTSSVKSKVEAKLEAAGIHTYKNSFTAYNGAKAMLVVSGNGYRAAESNTCFASVEFNVVSELYRKFGSVEATGKLWVIQEYAVISSCGNVVSGVANLNGSFLGVAERCVDSLVTEIYRGRRSNEMKELIRAFGGFTSKPYEAPE